MKNLIFTLAFVGLCFVVKAQDVYSQRQPGIIEENYKTFSFIDQSKKSTKDKKDKQELIVYEDPFLTRIWLFSDPAYPDTKSNASIKKAITQELLRKGYKKVDKDADMLVSYTVFKSDAEIPGNFTDDNGNAFPNSTETVKVKKGTLLISIMDRKNSKALWHGFDKNALGESASIEDTKVMKSVTSTLNSFVLN